MPGCWDVFRYWNSPIPFTPSHPVIAQWGLLRENLHATSFDFAPHHSLTGIAIDSYPHLFYETEKLL